MDASGLLTELRGMGLVLFADGQFLRVEPRAAITPEARELIRANKGAILALLSREAHQAVLDPFKGIPTVAEEAEIRTLLARQCPEDRPDYPEALRIALADPGAALEALREPAETWSAEKRAELRKMADECREAAA